MEAGSLVRRLRSDEWQAFRQLRLESLRTDPLAFGSTVEREAAYPDERWREWARRGSMEPREATFVATDPNGALIGMVGFFSGEEGPTVWGMWVQPSRRGRGVGRSLFTTLLGWIDRILPESKVVLEVNPDQASAVRIYSANGFRFTGVERPLGHDSRATVKQMTRDRAFGQ